MCCTPDKATAAANEQHHDGHDNRPEIALHPMAKRMACVGRPTPARFADEKENLIDRINERMN